MRGALRVFLNDFLELLYRPFMLVMLLTVPGFFLYVAGNIQDKDQGIRVLYQSNPDSKPDNYKVKRLLNEFTNIEIIDWQGADVDVLFEMQNEHADLALVWKDKWEFYSRSTTQEKQEYLTLMAYKIHETLLEGAPWQIILLGNALSNTDNTTLRVRPFYPVTSRNNISLVPKVISLIVVFLPFLLACGALIRERESCTLEILIVSPCIRWSNLFAGKLLLPVFLATINLFILLMLSESWFGIHVKENLPGIFFIQLLAMFASALLGFTVSTVVRTLVQAYLIAALYFLGLILMTGFIYPIEQSVALVKLSSHILPLTFSQVPFSAWMLEGTRAYLYAEQVYWLVAQCALFGIMAWLGISRVKRTI